MSKISKIVVEVRDGDTIGNIINTLENVSEQYPNAILDEIERGVEFIFKVEKNDE